MINLQTAYYIFCLFFSQTYVKSVLYSLNGGHLKTRLKSLSGVCIFENYFRRCKKLKQNVSAPLRANMSNFWGVKIIFKRGGGVLFFMKIYTPVSLIKYKYCIQSHRIPKISPKTAANTFCGRKADSYSRVNNLQSALIIQLEPETNYLGMINRICSVPWIRIHKNIRMHTNFDKLCKK